MTAKSETPGKRTALFAGSFNPFTVGHASLVERVLKICDRVIIAVGINANKESEDIELLLDPIRKLYEEDDRVTAMTYHGLTGDLVKETGADFILRGVRDTADFEYEVNMADANRNLFGVETIILTALPEYAWISSSLVRELRNYGRDCAALLPQPKKEKK